MKKLIASGIATLALLVVAVPAFASPVVSGNASAQSCFGQARAYYSRHGDDGVLGHRAGHYMSERKGNNAEMNHNYMDSCQL